MFTRVLRYIGVISLVLSLSSGHSFGNSSQDSSENSHLEQTLPEFCKSMLRRFPGGRDEKRLLQACEKALVLPECKSVKQAPVFHIQRDSSRVDARRILVFGLVHGDEPWSGSLARSWLERAMGGVNRNQWRIVPVINPDGYEKSTRTNANGVDINRNFPTQNWEKEASAYWIRSRKNARRFPGKAGASEPETQCMLRQIEDFRPDLVVAIHAPYRIMDLDGPKELGFSPTPLPWRRLGNFPGSLGRFLWRERSIPVLTVELGTSIPIKDEAQYSRLQDQVGQMAQRIKRRETTQALR